MTTSTKERELIETEQRFWDSMRNKDGATAAALTDDGSIIVGAQGVSKIDRKSMEKMTAEGPWELKEFSFDDKTRQVRFLTDDIAIVAYTVSEELVYEGKPLHLDAHDSSVWVRRDGAWRCALHTETPAGDPFGRSEQQKR